MAVKNFGVKQVNLIGASGTPTIESPNNININAVNVAISTDMSVGGSVGISSNITVTGIVTASSFSGDGSGLTGVASTDNIQTATSANFLSNVNIAGITTCQALTVSGNLTVDGTTTTINSTTLTVDDKTIVIASGAADSSAADGAGISIDGASATILYSHSGTKFVSNKPFEATSFTGDVTGNADTATTLETARTIAGVSFDGSSNISLNNNAITNGAGYITTSHAFTNTNQLTNGAGFITSSGTAALAEGLTGTPDISVGVITATSFSGDGSGLTGVASTDNIQTATEANFLSGVKIAGVTTTSNVVIGSGGAETTEEQNIAPNSVTTTTIYSGSGSLKSIRVENASTPVSYVSLYAIYVDDVLIEAVNHPGVVSNANSADGSTGWASASYPGSKAVDSSTSTHAMTYASWIQYTPTTPIPVTSSVKVRTYSSDNGIATIVQGGSLINSSGTASFTGIVTAASFVGDGSGLTGVASTDNIQTATVANFLDGITVAGVTTTSSNVNVTGNVAVTGNVSATNFNSTSDVTLKQDVSVIDNALEMISQLEGVSWKWKETLKPSLGVTAQNVEEVAPELVSNGDHKSVNYNGLIGILIEAVKELKSEVDELKR